MIPLSENENNLLYFCKGHYGKDFWPLVEKIYCKLYAMEESCLDGIHHMIYSLWRKLLVTTIDNPRFIEEYLELSTPSENWKVWGGLGSEDLSSFWNRESKKWENNDILKARICAMVSQLKLSDMKYWDKKPPTEEFAGLSLVTDSSFFSRNQ
jgi:hypothetical protein